MKPLLDEITEVIKESRFKSMNTEDDVFANMAQAAIDVVERRLLDVLKKSEAKVIYDGKEYISNVRADVVMQTWQAVKGGDV